MALKKKEAENKVENEVKITDLEVLRAKEYEGNYFCDLKVNGVTIYGCRFIEGKMGDFISFPSKKAKDGKYYNHAYVPFTEEQVTYIGEEIEKLL